MGKSIKILMGFGVVLSLIGCGTLGSDDVQKGTALIGNENQTGDLNTGADQNQGAPVENGTIPDSNEGVAPVNQGNDVNIGVLVPPQNGDLDGDGIKDIDDSDIDGDGVLNIDDSDIDGDGILNIDDNDIDGDGIANAADNDIDGDGIANVDDNDIDGDGIVNEEDVDIDGDGIVNEQDADIDGDGLANEVDADIDGDGLVNGVDTDIDGDGIDNSIDTDIDGDGLANEIDTDIDGDGIDNGSDEDINGDGIIDNTNIDAGVSVKVNQLDTTKYETFAGGATTLVFNHTVDLNDIRDEIAKENLQLGTVQIEDLKITLVMQGDAAEFVARYPTNKFTLDGRNATGTQQQVVYSLPNGLDATILAGGLSISEYELFVNATGFNQINKAIQDPSKATIDIEIQLVFGEALDKDYKLSFEFDLSVVGRKVL